MLRSIWCWICFSLLLTLISGCGSSSSDLPTPWEASGPLRTPADQLNASDLEHFLKIVRAHPQQQVPEFSPSNDDPGLSSAETAAALVQSSQQRFRQLFDPQRQGTLWAEDRDWARILHQHHAAPSEFAALVASVSCAVTRARLDSRTDLSELSKVARDEIKDLSAQLRDNDSRRQPMREKATARTQILLRLSRAAALLEFVDLLRQVPQENCTLVKEYAKQLRPLLPPTQADPFAELVEWQRQRGRPRETETTEHVRLRVGETLRR